MKTQNEMQVYIANLTMYNEGRLVGTWLQLPALESEIRAAFVEAKLGRYVDGEYVHGCAVESGGYLTHCEEYALHDWELPFNISEYTPLHEVNEICEAISRLDPIEAAGAIAAAEHMGIEIIEMIEREDFIIHHDCENMEDIAYNYVEETGMLDTMPENLRYYFDYEKLGRDMEIEGTFIRLDFDTWVEVLG